MFETRDDKLEVFVEPEAHDESKGPRPIAHIVVQSTSYIDGSRTDSESAIAKPGTCMHYSSTLLCLVDNVMVGDLRWSITHTSLSQEEKEYRIGKARERQWRAYSLPPGVSVEEMEEIWNQLDFGGRQRQLEGTSKATSGDSKSASPAPKEEKESTFNPSYFALPSRNVEVLRALSIKGKVDMELMVERMKGQPKLIWGEPEAYVDQVELDEMPTEAEVVEASELAGEPLVKCEEAVPVDEDIRADEVAVPLTDYSHVELERR